MVTANPIDLCTLSDVRLQLGISTVAGAALTNVNTTINSSFASGVQTVTPVSMTNIFVGSILSVDTGVNNELIIPTAITGSTFTANFTLSHTNPPTAVVGSSDTADMVISRVITAASSYILWRTGHTQQDGSIPTQSLFVQPVSFNETYDGYGNDRLFLRNSPIASVTLLTINGVTVNASTGWGSAGYVIDDSRKALAFQGASGYGFRFTRGYASYPYAFRSGYYCFAQGTQNINVQYSAGYQQTPYDLKDACIQLVAYNYRRRDWYGQKQVTQPQNEGVVQYEPWVVPPNVDQIIMNYTRRA